MSRRKTRAEAHVRLYRHELECPAYRSLSTDARALLVEFRALYDGRENRVYLSVREMMSRLHIGQRRAQRARDDLLERGFIYMLTTGGFTRKSRHASEYALTHEPLHNKDGATAPKDFMRWESQKSTVAVTATHCSRDDYTTDKKPGENTAHGSCGDYRQPAFEHLHGSRDSYTDRLPGGAGFIGAAIKTDGSVQFRLICAAVLLEASK